MQCTFCVLKLTEPADPSAALFAFICEVAASYFRAGCSVFVATESLAQSEALDELLWQRPAAGFVPHNLQGEGPAYGSPVEIGHLPPKKKRQVLINLQPHAPSFGNRFEQVIDVVPGDDAGKQLARQRFMAYRQQQFALQTIDITTLTDFKV